MRTETKQRTTDQASREVLAFLARSRDRLADFRRSLLLDQEKTTHAILDVVSDVECRQYESGLTVEIWIEADVAGGDALTWWLDIMPQENGWLLDGRVSWNGQDVVFELSPLIVADFHNAEQKAASMLEELFYAGRQVLHKRLSA